MELFDHVSELLYDHNCVIVPGFGGFVANFKASEYNADTGVVKPSRKMVAFNQNLIENDGLLIQHVAKKRNITYAEAERKVIDMVTYIWQRLDQYRNFEFRSVGTIYLNKDNKLVFVPYENHNFYTQSYGLPGIKVRPVHALTVQKKKLPVRKKPVEQHATQTTPVKAAPTPTLWKVTGIAATLLFFLGASYLGFRFSEPSSNELQITLNSVNDSEALGSIVDMSQNVPSREKVTTSSVTTTLQGPDVRSTERTIEETKVSGLTAETSGSRETVYHIIVARTKSRSEAEKLTEGTVFSLFSPHYIQDTGSDDMLVSIESFSSKEIAEQYLKEILKFNFKKAYLLEESE